MNRDDHLLEQLRAGTPAAWEQVVAELEGPLYRYFYFGGGDHHQAQELSAETFAQLVRSLVNFRGDVTQLRAFAFGIAQRVRLRQLRTAPPRCATLDESHLAAVEASPAEQLARRDLADRIQREIATLDEPLATVLLLRFLEDLSLSEIAAALDCPLGTVKSHVHRGRARLRKLFSEQECES